MADDADLIVKAGTVPPPLVLTLSDAAGTVDLTGATLTFRARLRGTTATAVTRAATPDADQTANRGRLSLAFQASDLADLAPGAYEAEIGAVWSGSGKSARFPTDAERPYLIMLVLPALA